MDRIIIDAGHGGRDNGAVYNGRREKDDNLTLALMVGDDLKRMGYDVVYVRQEDVYDTPAQKAAIANRLGGDLFLSFHRNSSIVPGRYEGVQTLVYNRSGIKYELAKRISENLSALGFRNVGVDVRPDLAVLRRTKMPAVLIETGFIDNEKDNDIYDRRLGEIAQVIADSVEEVLPLSKDSQYYVQTGLFRKESNARNLEQKLEEKGHDGTVDRLGAYYRVKVGPFDSLSQAAAEERMLRNEGFSTLIIRP